MVFLVLVEAMLVGEFDLLSLISKGPRRRKGDDLPIGSSVALIVGRFRGLRCYHNRNVRSPAFFVGTWSWKIHLGDLIRFTPYGERAIFNLELLGRALMTQNVKMQTLTFLEHWPVIFLALLLYTFFPLCFQHQIFFLSYIGG